MKKVKISVATLMSIMLVTSSLMSCSIDDKNNADNQSVNKSLNSSSATTDWFSFVQSNAAELNDQFQKGISQSELDTLLESLGYKQGALTLGQFNQIYSEILQHQNEAMDFDKMYEDYYSSKPKFFTETLKSVLSNSSIDDKIGTTEWNNLSYEDQNILLGLQKLVQIFPVSEDSAARGGGDVVVLFGGTIRVNEHVAVIGFWTLIGAGTGMAIGGPVGAGIGAVVGAVVGFVMDAVK